MKTLLTLITVTTLAFGSAAYAADDSSQEIHHTALLDSGTYTVTAERVDPEEKEIYVKTADGKILELYFKARTKLTQGGKDVEFSALKKGQKLEVKVEKSGKHLNPLEVKILE